MISFCLTKENKTTCVIYTTDVECGQFPFAGEATVTSFHSSLLIKPFQEPVLPLSHVSGQLFVGMS